MANIFKFKALENIECRFFDSIDSSIVNIETIKPDIDDDFENDHSELGCQLDDGRWIIIRWNHGDDHSIARPAYYSSLWGQPMLLKDEYIVCEFRDCAADVKKQVEQWLPHLNDQYFITTSTNAILMYREHCCLRLSSSWQQPHKMLIIEQ